MASNATRSWSTEVEGDEHALWFMKKDGDATGSFSLSDDFESFVKWEDHPLKYLFATVCLVTMLTWIVVALIFRYSSVAALVSIALAPVYAWSLGEPQAAGLSIFLAVFVWIRHYGNIRRLLRGEESRIRLRKSGA